MAGYSAFGTLFTVGSSTTVNAVAELTSISGPGVTVNTIDVTSHDSDDAYNEFVAGLIDGGDISFDGNLTSAVAGNVIMTAINGRSTQRCAVIYPTGVAWTFNAIVTGLECDAPHDGKIGFSGSAKVTGMPDLSSG